MKSWSYPYKLGVNPSVASLWIVGPRGWEVVRKLWTAAIYQLVWNCNILIVNIYNWQQSYWWTWTFSPCCRLLILSTPPFLKLSQSGLSLGDRTSNPNVIKLGLVIINEKWVEIAWATFEQKCMGHLMILPYYFSSAMRAACPKKRYVSFGPRTQMCIATADTHDT